MKPFEQLTHLGRLRRLRTLALAVLARYDLTDFELRQLGNVENTVYCVTARSRSRSRRMAARETFVLRMSRPGYQRESWVRSEAQWLEALRADAGLSVPDPQRARDGTVVQSVSAPGVPATRFAVLFRWQSGRFDRRGFTPKNLVRVGEFMARLRVWARYV